MRPFGSVNLNYDGNYYGKKTKEETALHTIFLTRTSITTVHISGSEIRLQVLLGSRRISGTGLGRSLRMALHPVLIPSIRLNQSESLVHYVNPLTVGIWRVCENLPDTRIVEKSSTGARTT